MTGTTSAGEIEWRIQSTQHAAALRSSTPEHYALETKVAWRAKGSVVRCLGQLERYRLRMLDDFSRYPMGPISRAAPS